MGGRGGGRGAWESEQGTDVDAQGLRGAGGMAPRAGTALQQMREEAGLVPCPSSEGGLLAWLLRGLKFVVPESRTR